MSSNSRHIIIRDNNNGWYSHQPDGKSYQKNQKEK